MSTATAPLRTAPSPATAPWPDDVAGPTAAPKVDAGPELASAIYEGIVVHRRFGEPSGVGRPAQDPEHAFTQDLYLCWLDLDEIERCFDGRWWWSARHPAPARFRRDDFLGDPDVPLDQAVRDLVEERAGFRPAGPVRLLAQVRHFGVLFNPLSLYWCYDAVGERVVAVVAEITNTPWLERHVHVLVPPWPLAPGELARFEHAKELHVSPFLPMDLSYRWVLRAPDARLRVELDAWHHDRRVFSATLVLRRHPWSTGDLARAVVRHPAMSVAVVTGIYAQALRLWRKGARFQPHPRQAGRRSPRSGANS